MFPILLCKERHQRLESLSDSPIVMVSARTQTPSHVFQLHSLIPPMSSYNLRVTSLTTEWERRLVREYLTYWKVRWLRNNTLVTRIHMINPLQGFPRGLLLVGLNFLGCFGILGDHLRQPGQLGAFWVVQDQRWGNSRGHRHTGLALTILFICLTSPVECKVLRGKHCNIVTIEHSEVNAVLGT